MIDFSRLDVFNNLNPVNPRDIFMSLTPKNKKYQYPRDVQGEVWKQWFDNRENKDTIIKMNTGSGKTVVALMILQSCLNEGIGPAVYVVPDNYLVGQVIEQAKELGMKIAESEDELNFQRGKAIFVTNINKIVNGKSVFGLRETGNYQIGSLLIDDVHACVDKIQQQFSVTIESDNQMYNDIINTFRGALENQSKERFSDIINHRANSDNMLVPFWSWQEKNSEIYSILSENSEEECLKFKWNLIKENLKLSHCYISTKQISIIPNCTPLYRIDGFNNATRRIYMSATLPDDSSFVTVMGIKLLGEEKVITPEKANDIGERLMLVPKAINNDIIDEEVMNMVVKMSEDYNVVVIVPSFSRALLWSEKGGYVLSPDTISEGVNKIKSSTNGLFIIVNRYDGIDLPDDACRVLVIDGLPNIRNMNDKYESEIAGKSERVQRELIQRIEQGMGRGVRAYNDYCLIILMGNQLTSVLYQDDGRKFFSNATKAQYELSEKICEQVEGKSVEEIMELGKAILERNLDWISLCKKATSEMLYEKNISITKAARAIRGAFDKACIGDYSGSKELMEELVNSEPNDRIKGYYKQLLAEYINFVDKSEAQQILKSAKKSNMYVLNPIEGINFDKEFKNSSDQAKNIIDVLNNIKGGANGLILYTDDILDSLVFEENSSVEFEKAIKDIYTLIGFEGKQPEKESGKGPDDFISLGNGNYLVIECKNETTTDSICKHDCNQLNGSYQWFINMYPRDAKCTPIMIHNSNVFNYECSPNEHTRIMTPKLLDKFKKNIREFVAAICRSENYRNSEKVNMLIREYKLNKNALVSDYTTEYKIKNQ